MALSPTLSFSPTTPADLLAATPTPAGGSPATPGAADLLTSSAPPPEIPEPVAALTPLPPTLPPATPDLTTPLPIGGPGAPAPVVPVAATTAGTHLLIAELQPVGGSTAQGSVVVVETAGKAFVDLHADGLVASQPQISQIESPPPPPGSAVDGPVLLNLTVNQAAPTSDAGGRLGFDQVVSTGALPTLAGDQLVIHGAEAGQTFNPAQPVAVGVLQDVSDSLFG